MGDGFSLLAPALVGVVVGVLSGMLGIGGGTVLVPVFRLLFGMNPVAATATSLFTIIPTSLSGAFSHMKGKTCVFALGLAMGLGGALTSPIGVWLATVSPGWAIMLGASVVIGYSACTMLAKAINMPRTRAVQNHSSAAVTAEQDIAGRKAALQEADPPKMTKRQLALGVLIGVGAGVISGYVGVGGGFIMVPLMLSVLALPMRYASGTSLVAVILLAIPGVIEQGVLGNVDYLAGIVVAVGSIPGAIVGSRLSKRIPERALRFLFGGFLLIAAALLVVNELGILS